MRSTFRRSATLALALTACHGNSAPSVSTDTLGWIRVDHGRLRDDTGREWLLHGINARVSGLFDVTFDDGRQPLETIPDFTADDAKRMAALGFNFLRLPINWSGLEPARGQFSQAYLQRLSQVVEWCRQAGLYVLIDFHQDAYSKEIGEDGAPLWAVLPTPTTPIGGPLTDLGQRRTSPPVQAAYDHFFNDDQSLQEQFLEGWATVVSAHASESHVIGFEVMNEPSAFQVNNGAALLQAFYVKAATSMRKLDARHTLWLEPDAGRNLSLAAPLLTTPFPDANVVYEPHLYPALLTVPSNSENDWRTALTATFDAMVAEGESWGGATVLGEWGQNPDTAGAPYIHAVRALAEDHAIGEGFWLWKEQSQGNWGLFDASADGSWKDRTAGMREVATPYAMAVPGRLAKHQFDRATATLTVSFVASGSEAAPLLYLPVEWYPNGTTVSLNGNRVEAGSGRVLLPWSGDAGTFDLVVAPK